jgi:hypothetical protein
MILNLKKKTSAKIPFLGVIREARGTVIVCARKERTNCAECIFVENCAIRTAEVMHD